MQYYGIYQAVVSNIKDPKKRGRIKVICPTVLCEAESAWCDPVVYPVCKDYDGDFCVPSVNEAVWIMFMNGDINKPVYLGGWYSDNKTPVGNDYSSVDKFRIISFNGSAILMKKGTIELVSGNASILLKNTGVEITGNLKVNGTITSYH